MTTRMDTPLIQPRVAQRLERLRVGWGKDPALGFLLGFLLGPIGVGLYLRSITHLGLSAVTLFIVLFFTGTLTSELIGGCLCGLWIVLAVMHRAHRAKHADHSDRAEHAATTRAGHSPPGRNTKSPSLTGTDPLPALRASINAIPSEAQA